MGGRNEAGGTAFGSRVSDFEMGGKTGTAQVVGREANTAGAAIPAAGQRLVRGLRPGRKPAMVVVVFVENGGHGNLAAAPLAKLLFETRFGTPAAARGASACRRGPHRPAAERRGFLDGERP